MEGTERSHPTNCNCIFGAGLWVLLCHKQWGQHIRQTPGQGGVGGGGRLWAPRRGGASGRQGGANFPRHPQCCPEHTAWGSSGHLKGLGLRLLLMPWQQHPGTLPLFESPGPRAAALFAPGCEADFNRRCSCLGPHWEAATSTPDVTNGQFKQQQTGHF